MTLNHDLAFFFITAYFISIYSFFVPSRYLNILTTAKDNVNENDINILVPFIMVSVFYYLTGCERGEGGTVRYLEYPKIMTVFGPITDGEFWVMSVIKGDI